jgi:hypothetical protein
LRKYVCPTFDAEVVAEADARAIQLRVLGFPAAAAELEALAVALRARTEIDVEATDLHRSGEDEVQA